MRINNTVTYLLVISFIFGLSSSIEAQRLKPIPLSRQDTALIEKYLEKADEHLSLNHLKEASDFYNQTAIIYWEHNRYEKASEFYKKSLKINEDLGNENGIAMINSNLALIHADNMEFDKALDKFRSTLSIRKSKGEKVGTISALINISVVLNNQMKYSESAKNLKEALDIAREMNDPNQMKSCYGMLAETYEKAGKPDSSFYYFNYYRTFHEMIQKKRVQKTRQELENERLRSQLIETEKEKKELELLKNKFELKKKDEELQETTAEKENLLENLTKKELQVRVIKKNAQIKELEAQRQIDRKQKTVYTISVGLIIMLLLAGLLMYAYRQKRRTNKALEQKNTEINHQKDQLAEAYDLIEKKNKKITGSINYAKLIQTAMMSKIDKLEKFIPDSFIFFRPLDVVSGDFYWYTEIDNKVVITAVDCTGHGVPGGFLSMIGSNLLNQIVDHDRITDPAEILTKLDEGVKVALHQDHTDNSDGMDMALAVIDKEQKKIHFSGAKNPLFYFVNDEANQIKGSLHGIGGFQVKDRGKGYSTSTMEIEEGTAFYVFSDGFIDQYGGRDGRERFKKKRFREMLLSIHKRPMQDQQLLIEEQLLEWKNNSAQIDDILVIGFRI